MYIKRTLILNNYDDNNVLGIAVIEKSNNKVEGLIKNLVIDKDDFVVVQLNDNQFYTYPIKQDDGIYSFVLEQNLDYNNQINIAIFNPLKNKIEYLGATSSKDNFKLYLNDNITKISKNIETYKLSLKENEKIFTPPTQKEVEEIIDKALNQNDDTFIDNKSLPCDKCIDCIYKKAFFESHKNDNNNKEENEEDISLDHNESAKDSISIKKLVENNEKILEKNNEDESPSDSLEDDKEENNDDKDKTFYDQIKPSLDDLFKTYPKDEFLMQKIENSYFVKVDYEEGSKPYSIGVIKNDSGEVELVCYAILSEYSKNATFSSDFTEWLPLDDKSDKGYYLMYQLSSTGESVKKEQ
jgi:hypothetical protein